MIDVTQILRAMGQGDAQAADQLLPLIYDELRRLAASKMAREAPGNTLNATALAHEAYIRLVDVNQLPHWNSRGHFFAAAAEAMRRILVESARCKSTQKHGGCLRRHDADLDQFQAAESIDPVELLAIHEGLEQLAERSPRKAELVKLRYFLGCTVPEAAEILRIAPATAEEDWTYARAWLRRHFQRGEEKTSRS